MQLLSNSRFRMALGALLAVLAVFWFLSAREVEPSSARGQLENIGVLAIEGKNQQACQRLSEQARAQVSSLSGGGDCGAGLKRLVASLPLLSGGREGLPTDAKEEWRDLVRQSARQELNTDTVTFTFRVTQSQIIPGDVLVTMRRVNQRWLADSVSLKPK